MKKIRTEWVIHIWGKRRDKMELTDVEKFHFDMIGGYDLTRFDKVLINIAMDDIDSPLFDFLSDQLRELFSQVKEVEIMKCQNDGVLCEAVTFKPYVLDRIGEDVRVFYSHFKGYVSNVVLINSDNYPFRNIYLNEKYWSYLMYKMSLEEKYFDEMEKSFDDNKDVYCWCLLEKNNTLRNQDFGNESYYTHYFNLLRGIKPNVDSYFDESMLYTHSPGSFVWYDLKNLGEHLGDELDYVKDVDFDGLGRVGCASHLCELYIWQFLNKENVQEQTCINNMNEQWAMIGNRPYSRLFVSKIFCKEYLGEFERYIINKQII